MPVQLEPLVRGLRACVSWLGPTLGVAGGAVSIYLGTLTHNQHQRSEKERRAAKVKAQPDLLNSVNNLGKQLAGMQKDIAGIEQQLAGMQKDQIGIRERLAGIDGALSLALGGGGKPLR